MKVRQINQSPTKSHRSLSRTENSNEKLAQKRQKQRLKSASSQNKQSYSKPHSSSTYQPFLLDTIKAETKEFHQKIRSKSGKMLFGLFRKAHHTNQNQSFLQKVPKQRIKMLNKQIRSHLKGGQSQQIPTIYAQSESPQYKTQKNVTMNRVLKYQNIDFNSPEMRFKTINSISFSKVFTPQQLKIHRENIEQSKSTYKHYSTKESHHQNTYKTSFLQQNNRQVINNEQIVQMSMESQHRQIQSIQNGQEINISTKKKSFRQYKKQDDRLRSSTQQKQRNIVDSSNKQIIKQRLQFTAGKKNLQVEQINFDQVQTVEPLEKKERKQKSLLNPKKTITPKKDSSMYNDIDDIEIEEISFNNEVNNNQKSNEKNMNDKLQRAKLSKNPYLPVESNIKVQSNSKEMRKTPSKLQSNLQEFVSIDSKPLLENKSSPAKPQIMQKIDKKSQLNPKPHQQSSLSQSLSSSAQTQKTKILLILSKISKMHSKLQMLGQLATYFSQNSKSFKLVQQSKQYIRKDSLSWHFMVYLFFKYFYYMLLLFSKYYAFCSNIVSFKKQQMIQLNEQNKKWEETLNKIEKSVKKNTKPCDYDENYLKKVQLSDFQDKFIVVKLIQFYLLQQGTEESFNLGIYMKSLKDKIYRQVANYIKSLNLTNMLGQNNNIAKIFRQSAFRVFNSTIILYQFNHIEQPQIKTIENIQQLSNPSFDLFKQFYDKLTKQILVKK